MHEHVSTYIDAVTFGEPQACKNLTMVPLLSAQVSAAQYLLLDEALSLGLLEVGEISPDGSVPQLRVVNRADKDVLILDGEELVGAKQNRIVNTTILIQALSSVIIPVSCVEQGRWHYSGDRFAGHGNLLCSEIRAAKAVDVKFSLNIDNSYRSDQGRIWDCIEAKARRRNAVSPSMAMSEIFEKDSGSIDEYLSEFAAAENQAGAVFLINGEIAGLDSFSGPDTFGKVFSKLLRSYALDALDRSNGKKSKAESAPQHGLPEFFDSLRSAATEQRASVAAGTDIRIESDAVIGFALEHEQAILHLACFPKNGTKKQQPESPLQRSSRRRDRL